MSGTQKVLSRKHCGLLCDVRKRKQAQGGIHLGKAARGSNLRAGKSLQVPPSGLRGSGLGRGDGAKLEASETLTEPGEGGAGQR